MAELSFREAIAAGIAQEMARDEMVYFIGEDIGAAGGVFKATVGLFERFGPERVRDTPISEQAIIGAAMGAAMTGLRPIAEIMFSDFLATCWDMVANQVAKTRYMTDGQVSLPLVIRTANGGGTRFGAQHSQSLENWGMAVPGLKVVAPSNPADAKGLLAAAIRDPDPVLFFEQKSLYGMKGEVPDGEHVDRLGTAKVLRNGRSCTIVALAAMVPKAMEAADKLEAMDIDATVVDIRSLVPLDTRTILGEIVKTGRLFTVEENPRLCGWGAEIASIAADECFDDLDGPIVRITTPHVPLPAADVLEDAAMPSVERIVETVKKINAMTPVSELISVRHTDLYIGGSWHPATDGQRIEVTDPATGEVISTVASASVADALEAVQAASDAFRPWAAKPPRQRAEILRKAFELMIRDQEKLAELMVRENGKPMAEARGEVAYAGEFFRWFSEEAVRNIGSVSISPSGANRILVEHQPIGVSVLVTPWNFPAAMATRKIGPALAAGCTVVLKPASETPLTALAIADLLEQAGVPKGVVNVIPSKRSSEVVKAMLKDPRVRKLSFTGSTEVGRILLAQAAENVISCSMELGGNAPFIVLEDADLDAALEGALIAKMRNTGQSCIAANRFYVDAKVAQKFADMLAKSMGALAVGSGLDADVKVGPVINDPARQKMLGLVEEAAGHGARVLTGGKAPNRPGYFVPPTVLTEVNPDEHILNEEIFGPIAPIVTFRDIDQAIEYANKTDRGLAAYVYTRDLAKGLRIAEAIESGMVGLNRGFISDPAAPFGGVKQSGVGREGSHEGLLEFLETKYIATNW